MRRPLTAIGRPVTAIGNRLPQGWGDLLRQLLLFFVIYQGYQVVRGLVDGKQAVALANADRVIDAERALGTYFEPGLQSALLGHEWIIDLANFLYMNLHFVVTISFLAWLYLFRNRHFYFVRNMFLVAMGLALLGYALFPTAPPRLTPGAGVVDTINEFAGVNQDSNAVSLLVNKYAAVPSMHIGFSLMIAIPAIMLIRNLAVRAVWAIYPVIVFFVIVVTAQHYWLDAAAGAATAAVAALVATRLLARARPEVWSFRPGREAAGEATA